MSDEDNENIDSLNDDDTPDEDDPSTEEDSPEGDDTTTDDDPDGDSEVVEEIIKKNTKLSEQNVKLFERAKKAEGYLKAADGSWVKKPKSAPKPQADKKIEITPMDTIALMGAKVTNADDINEVLDYARFKNIPVGEALESNVVKTTLANKIAERETAQATAIKGGKRGAHKPSGDELISQADEGKFPEDASELAKARMEQKKSKK